MSATYPQNIRDEVIQQKTDYINSFFADAESVLAALGLANNVYYRDLYFDNGSNEIREIATNNRVATLPQQLNFMYQPQGVQLLVLALDYNYYPV